MSLTIDQLACVRGTRVIWKQLSISAGQGSAVTLTGPNGSGKSTLLAVLAGALPAAAGTITYGGKALSPKDVHWLSHADGLPATLTVRETLALWAALFGTSDIDPLECLKLRDLADKKVATLSAGQKRRTALARFLVAKRPVWLMDEPAAALDGAAQKLLSEIVAAHRAAGGIVIAATHDALPWPRQMILNMGVT